MKVLILGANGYLGPHVVEALAPHHRLRITDIKPPRPGTRERYSGHEFLDVDITAADQVLLAAKGMDAILNLAVLRPDRIGAFRVNMLGCYHVMRAAVECGIRRVINTGPHFTVAGPGYEQLDFAISPDVPPHPGTGLYPLTKSLGQEICRAFTETHDIYVQEYLFYDFRRTDQIRRGGGGIPFIVSWSDAAEVFRLGLEIDLARLPSMCEVFFILGNNPQGKFLNEKARRILGFTPKDDTSILWRKTR
jgi:NAD dependent epimerase/dehydratase family